MTGKTSRKQCERARRTFPSPSGSLFLLLLLRFFPFPLPCYSTPISPPVFVRLKKKGPDAPAVPTAPEQPSSASPPQSPAFLSAPAPLRARRRSGKRGSRRRGAGRCIELERRRGRARRRVERRLRARGEGVSSLDGGMRGSQRTLRVGRGHTRHVRARKAARKRGRVSGVRGPSSSCATPCDALGCMLWTRFTHLACPCLVPLRASEVNEAKRWTRCQQANVNARRLSRVLASPSSSLKLSGALLHPLTTHKRAQMAVEATRPSQPPCARLFPSSSSLAPAKPRPVASKQVRSTR